MTQILSLLFFCLFSLYVFSHIYDYLVLNWGSAPFISDRVFFNSHNLSLTGMNHILFLHCCIFRFFQAFTTSYTEILHWEIEAVVCSYSYTCKPRGTLFARKSPDQLWIIGVIRNYVVSHKGSGIK